jgi:prefoldin subunit 5
VGGASATLGGDFQVFTAQNFIKGIVKTQKMVVDIGADGTVMTSYNGR